MLESEMFGEVQESRKGGRTMRTLVGSVSVDGNSGHASMVQRDVVTERSMRYVSLRAVRASESREGADGRWRSSIGSRRASAVVNGVGVEDRVGDGKRLEVGKDGWRMNVVQGSE